jgi:hypothetical protein
MRSRSGVVLGWLLVQCACGGGGSSRPALIWVPDMSGAVLAFAMDADGDATPVRRIEGAATTILEPSEVRGGPDGDLYVADFIGGPGGVGRVLVFPPDADGDVAPIRTISGTHTGIGHAMSLAVADDGQVYVGNREEQNVVVFAAGADGDATPVRTITGLVGEKWSAYQVALASDGTLWVAAEGLLHFAADADGEATPLAWITGGLCEGVAVGADVYCGFEIGVHAYASDADGSATPLRTIVGAATGMEYGEGLALYDENLVFSDCDSSSLRIFPTGGDGDITPTRVITGPSTGLTCPLRPSVF